MSLEFDKYYFILMKAEEEPIDISDGEEKQMQLQLQPKGNTSFDVQWTVCKQDCLSQTNGQKILLNRLIKFFFYDTKIQPSKQHSFKRKQAKPYEIPIRNQIVLFGCDFVKIKNLRKQYQTTKSKSINVSNVIFYYDNFEAAIQALRKNALQPNEIIIKQEQQIDLVPQIAPILWFEMKPYQFLNQQVRLFARFATKSDEQVQSQLQQKTLVYRQSSQIYNFQQHHVRKLMRRQKLQIRKDKEVQKQKNTQKLYEVYKKSSGQEWKNGIQKNPGACRDQRERSRQKNKDNASNYSFLQKNSEQAAESVINGFNNLKIDSNSIKGNDTSNLSFTIRQPPSKQPRWSYSKYVQQQFAKQQAAKKKPKPIQCIIIQD